MSDAPSILVLTSKGSEPSVVTPVLAALEAVGTKLRAFDAGRVGGSGSGAVDWVVRAISGEVVERQLEREIESIRPDAVLCFEVGPTLAACSLRKSSARPFPILAVVPDLAPSSAWAQCAADRFFVVDDEAAVALEDKGVSGHTIVPVGSIGEVAYAEAGGEDRKSLRARFKLSGKVVLVEVNGLGHEKSSQLALQLSLVKEEITYLFDAGSDRDAASALRTQVPVLGMKAKLFGDTDDAPSLWRCADVVLARPSVRAVSRAASVGAGMVSYSPRGGAEERRAEALEERERGATADNALLVASALARALKIKKSALSGTGLDGAGTIADAAYLIGKERLAVLEDKHKARSAGRAAEVEDAAEYAQWAATAAQPAGALEDLGGSGGPAPDVPDAAKLRRLQKEVADRKNQVSRTIADAQKQASKWAAKQGQADKLGNASMAKTAERNADMERTRMHGALAEMAALETEERNLKRAAKAAASAPPPSTRKEEASKPSPSSSSTRRSTRTRGTSVHARPSVDDELDRMRREAGETPEKSKSSSSKRTKKKSTRKSRKKGAGVDDELAALKRKMAKDRK